MKKAILFVIALAVVSVTRAAAVDWSIGLTDSLLTNYAGSSIYSYALIGEGDTRDISALVDSWAADNSYQDTASGVWAGGIKTLNALGLTDGSIAGFEVDRSTGVDYLVVILQKDDGSYMWAYRDGTEKPYIDTRDENAGVDTDNSVVFDNNSVWTEVAASNPGGGEDPNVPEPTALALLALGVAGLALKRKVA